MLHHKLFHILYFRAQILTIMMKVLAQDHVRPCLSFVLFLSSSWVVIAEPCHLLVSCLSIPHQRSSFHPFSSLCRLDGCQITTICETLRVTLIPFRVRTLINYIIPDPIVHLVVILMVYNILAIRIMEVYVVVQSPLGVGGDGRPLLPTPCHLPCKHNSTQMWFFKDLLIINHEIFHKKRNISQQFMRVAGLRSYITTVLSNDTLLFIYNKSNLLFCQKFATNLDLMQRILW